MGSSSAPIRGGGGRARNRPPEPLGRGEATGDQPDRGALDIALAAGDLAGEPQARRRLQAQQRIEQHAAEFKQRVAMQAAEPRELGRLKTRRMARSTRHSARRI